MSGHAFQKKIVFPHKKGIKKFATQHRMHYNLESERLFEVLLRKCFFIFYLLFWFGLFYFFFLVKSRNFHEFTVKKEKRDKMLRYIFTSLVELVEN